jgi:hypothetical protein
MKASRHCPLLGHRLCMRHLVIWGSDLADGRVYGISAFGASFVCGTKSLGAVA